MKSCYVDNSMVQKNIIASVLSVSSSDNSSSSASLSRSGDSAHHVENFGDVAVSPLTASHSNEFNFSKVTFHISGNMHIVDSSSGSKASKQESSNNTLVSHDNVL